MRGKGGWGKGQGPRWVWVRGPSKASSPSLASDSGAPLPTSGRAGRARPVGPPSGERTREGPRDPRG